MRNTGLIFLFLTSLNLLACSSIELLPSPPPPQPLFIEITPSLYPLYRETILACGKDNPGFALFIKEKPSQDLDLEINDITIQLGEPTEISETLLYQIGDEEIIIIAGSGIHTELLNITEIKNLFTSVTQGIKILTYPENQEIRRWFDALFLFNAKESPFGQIVPGPEQMLIEIHNNPDSIGYILKRWISADYSIIEINHLEEAWMQQPVIAQIKTNSDKKVVDFVGCLQKEWGDR